jgi:hypothetical protein
MILQSNRFEGCWLPVTDTLRLRKITSHAHAPAAYRVVLRLDDGSDLEIGAIGEQVASHQRRYWSWGIDTVLPIQAFATAGEAHDREDAMAQFKAVWLVFASDPDRLAEFIRYATQRR